MYTGSESSCTNYVQTGSESLRIQQMTHGFDESYRHKR